MSSFSYSPAASSHFPQHSVFWHDCVQQCLYMHMCVCVESWKRGLALSITKKRGVHKDYNNVKEGGKKKGRRGEMKRKHRSSLNCLRLLAEKSIHRWAAWSKREFVQSDFILTFLAFSPPPPADPQPPLECNSLQTESSAHAVRRSLCIGDTSTMNQKEGRPQIKWWQRALMR